MSVENRLENEVKFVSTMSDSVWSRISRYMGLSEYEARVYVSLVRIGISGASRLSMESGVPRTKIYSVLRRLVERGLVMEVPNKPMEFAPISPKKVFSKKLREMERNLKALKGIIETLERAYLGSKVKPPMEPVWVFRSPHHIDRILNVLSDAKHDVKMMLDKEYLYTFFREGNKLLDDLIERGVCVTIMTPVDEEDRFLVRELSYVCKVKPLQVEPPVSVFIVDGKHVILARRGLAAYSRGSVLPNLLSHLLTAYENILLADVV